MTRAHGRGKKRFRACLLGLLAVLLGACSAPPEALQHEAYVWQRRWLPELAAALRESAPLVERWHVLAAQAESGNRLGEVAVEVPALLASGRPLVAVVRIEGTLDPQREDALADAIPALLERWSSRSLPLAGVEIDHDASQSGLAGYARFLQRLRASLAARAATRRLPLLITLLPSWLDAPAELTALLMPVDEAVLQLHSVKNPSGQLFDAESARRSIRLFARLSDKPFRLALPTYGSRLTLAAHGRVLSVESEVPTAGAEPGEGDTPRRRELYVLPETMARFLRALQKNHPPRLQGVVWFRLPLESDTRSWSPSTWQAVVRNEPLATRLETKWQTSDEMGVRRVFLVNAGKIDAEYPASIRIPENCSELVGSDSYFAEIESPAKLWLRSRKGLLRSGRELEIGTARCPPSATAQIVP